MITDKTLIKLLLQKDNFDKYFNLIKLDSLAEETKIILRDIEAFYKEFNKSEIDLSEFNTFFTIYRHPEFKEVQKQLYRGLFESIQQETTDLLISKVIEQLNKEYLYFKVRELSILQSPVEELRIAVEEYERSINIIENDLIDVANSSYDSIFKQVIDKEGLSWRLSCLNQCLGKIVIGDFGIIAAYVNTGKTSFLASEASFMAQQMPENKSVLWFNNEGPENRVQRRVWQATLDLPIHTIIKEKDICNDKYKKLMKGNLDKIQVINAAGKTTKDIKKYCEKLNPGLIIFDQIDHISGFEKKSSTDVSRYKYLYQWGREISMEYAPVFAVSQCDATVTGKDKEGNIWGQRYIGQHQLDGAKIAKQAQAEFIITIGFDPDFPKTRYICVPKNKLLGGGGDRFIKTEVIFDSECSRYRDPL